MVGWDHHFNYNYVNDWLHSVVNMRAKISHTLERCLSLIAAKWPRLILIDLNKANNYSLSVCKWCFSRKSHLCFVLWTVYYQLSQVCHLHVSCQLRVFFVHVHKWDGCISRSAKLKNGRRVPLEILGGSRGDLNPVWLTSFTGVKLNICWTSTWRRNRLARSIGLIKKQNTSSSWQICTKQES